MTFFFNLLALRPCLCSVSLGANAQSAAPSGAGVAMCTWSGDVAELGTSSANARWKRGETELFGRRRVVIGVRAVVDGDL